VRRKKRGSSKKELGERKKGKEKKR